MSISILFMMNGMVRKTLTNIITVVTIEIYLDFGKSHGSFFLETTRPIS